MRILGVAAALMFCAGLGQAAEWRILTVDGAAAGEGAALSLDAEGRLSGSTGCNRFSGQAEVADGILTAGPALAATKMACPGPRAAQETAIFEMLSGPVTLDADLVASVVVLTGAGHDVTLVPAE